MEKKYALCYDVLSRFQEAGILQDLVIVGSWCIYFYKDYFADIDYSTKIRTRDIDFLIPLPTKQKKQVDISELLADKGFIVSFSASGFMRLEHPELIIDFLVPERGRGTDRPYQLPKLGINAQPLRFLDFLAKHTISTAVDRLNLKLPHPAAFAFHKLLVFKRRPVAAKAMKDKQEALHVLRALIAKKEFHEMRDIFHEMPRAWQNKVLNALDTVSEKDISDMLTQG